MGKLYKIFKTLRWDFPDYEMSAYTVLDADGGFGYAGSIEGAPDARITMDAERLHQVVYGRGNMAKMFLSGQIKLKGVPMYKLMRFVPLLGTFSGQLPGGMRGSIQVMLIQRHPVDSQ